MRISLIISALLLLLTSVVSAQTVSTTQMPQHSLTKWRENFKVRYFGEYLHSNLEKWDDNVYDQEGVKTAVPVSLYSQFNVQYKVAPTTSLLISPRFYNVFGDRNQLRSSDDQHVAYTDDWQFGVVQEFIKNKNVTYNGRLTHRHPFSTASQNQMIDSQIEYQNDIFWAVSPGLSVLMWNTYRYYAYEAGKNEDRYRINNTTIFNYDFNDKWKMQIYHELDLQHRAPKYGKTEVKKQDWNYFEKYKNHVALGLGYSPTPSITFVPFVKALNDKDWSAKTTQLGLWVMGKVF